VAEILGVPEQVAAIQARYAVERAAWRALLGAVRLTPADVLRTPPSGSSRVPSPDAWPEPPPDDARTALELLECALGAYVIEDRAQR
jgi:hypothetical protein